MLFPLESEKPQLKKKPTLCYNSGYEMRVGDGVRIIPIIKDDVLLGYDIRNAESGQQHFDGWISDVTSSSAHNNSRVTIEYLIHKDRMWKEYTMTFRIRETSSEYAYFMPVIRKPKHENFLLWREFSKTFKEETEIEEEDIIFKERLCGIEKVKPRKRRKKTVGMIIEDIRNHFEFWKSIDPAYAQRLADEMEHEEGTEFRKTVLDGIVPFPNSKRKSNQSGDK